MLYLLALKGKLIIDLMKNPAPKTPRPTEDLIPTHGGYRNLKSFQLAQLCFDETVRFCERYVAKRDRTHDQMVQAARSGTQNIAEGWSSGASRTRAEPNLSPNAAPRPKRWPIGSGNFMDAMDKMDCMDCPLGPLGPPSPSSPLSPLDPPTESLPPTRHLCSLR
jgi:hypothetical protein